MIHEIAIAESDLPDMHPLNADVNAPQMQQTTTTRNTSPLSSLMVLVPHPQGAHYVSPSDMPRRPSPCPQPLVRPPIRNLLVVILIFVI